ncbi:MAG: hypothetical protein OJI67_01140 [Prosthecobacter sp.]|nr:hypothetical protein [Prosthecobacter sp.]
MSSPILTDYRATTFEDAQRKWKEYKSYIDSIRHRLPAGIAQIADAEWRYDAANSKSFHDASLLRVSILPRQFYGDDFIDIEMELLGACEDIVTKIGYKSVIAWNLAYTKAANLELNQDEFFITEEGFAHRIVWVNGTIWEIIFTDIYVNQTCYQPNGD